MNTLLDNGTTAVVCQARGVEWVGTELEPEYVAIANKRLSQVQGSLFNPLRSNT